MRTEYSEVSYADIIPRYTYSILNILIIPSITKLKTNHPINRTTKGDAFELSTSKLLLENLQPPYK